MPGGTRFLEDEDDDEDEYDCRGLVPTGYRSGGLAAR
jgi:hypothetical protein